jgi:hypothetical protein
MARMQFETWHYQDNEQGVEYEIQVHKVTDETAGEVRTRNGVATPKAGDYLVKDYRPDEYHVFSAKDFDGMGYEKGPVGESGVSTVEVVQAPEKDDEKSEEKDDESKKTSLKPPSRR